MHINQKTTFITQKNFTILQSINFL